MSNKKSKKENSQYNLFYPKDLDGVISFMKECMAAYGFKGKDSTFPCNNFLHVRNIAFRKDSEYAIMSFDVDYENGESYLTKSMSAKYNLKTYKTVIRDIKKMIKNAEKLTELVFINGKFFKPMFKRLALENKGWKIIH